MLKINSLSVFKIVECIAPKSPQNISVGWYLLGVSQHRDLPSVASDKSLSFIGFKTTWSVLLSAKQGCCEGSCGRPPNAAGSNLGILLFHDSQTWQYLYFNFLSTMVCTIYSSFIYIIFMWSIHIRSFPRHHIPSFTLLANISISFSPKNQDIQDFFKWGLPKSLEFGHLYIYCILLHTHPISL